MLGGGLAPAVDWGTALGRGDAGAGLLVAVAPTVAKGGLGLLAEVSTFSGSRGLRTAACRHSVFRLVLKLFLLSSILTIRDQTSIVQTCIEVWYHNEQ